VSGTDARIGELEKVRLVVSVSQRYVLHDISGIGSFWTMRGIELTGIERQAKSMNLSRKRSNALREVRLSFILQHNLRQWIERIGKK